MPSKLPWDNVKAESLRSICSDLGRRLSTRAEMIAFLGKVEDEGYAALAVDPPKRKARRPPKEVSNANDEPESGHRAKRVRKSIGEPTIKSQRKERAERRSPKKFDGVILPSQRKSARHEVAQEASGEEAKGEVSDADNNAEAGSTDGL
ncbi:hypothetical protein PILCRDRAFT_262210 [Piloderma croceum F 1598]|uniref:Uncharacterized protein n=1 Tax=Piloderma croceum (strain F 1598) TaxID=765440 RepID=A0A0C3CDM9_PILCF|nr:hypothetical protein PILCRDRAFT_262210 [Piloderma croceum F 1598]